MTEQFWNATDIHTKYNGFIDDTFQFVYDSQLGRPDLWARFVQQFREDADYEGGWRGEYWGKMMRGASFVYQYSQNEDLYNILKQTVMDMMATADDSGRISSYAVHHEFEAWDLWCRKYVLLGMEYFLEICKDEQLRKDIIHSMCRQVDYIISHIGEGEGKKEITAATRHWRGLNSSSVLEPIVRLYQLTGEKRYFDFAEYIVKTGCTDVENIFNLAYENKLHPYQYPVTKAYEMISCFEGLVEFYKVTKEEKHKRAIINFADKILETDFTVIGCSGCSQELFDHSTVRQANTTNDTIMQETCVTVTLMKFLYRVHLLTGHPKYADAFEISFYNAYLGSVNTKGVIEPSLQEECPDWDFEPLPFDSYSPLTAGTRGNGIGGLKRMSDQHYYGCCACIGSAGIGLVPKMHLLNTAEGLVINLYADGTVSALTPNNNPITLDFVTQYPKLGEIKIGVHVEESEKFEILLRNPYWSKQTKLYVNGHEEAVCGGYIKLNRLWQKGDVIELILDMRTEAIYPIPYGSQILMNKVIWKKHYIVPNYDEEDPIAHKHIALRRGPVMLAQENRLGYDVDDAVDIQVGDDGYVDVLLTEKAIAYDCLVKTEVPLANEGTMTVTDYASAGKLWNEDSKMAVWMLIQ